MKYLSELNKKDLSDEVCLVRAGFDILNEDIKVLGKTIPFRIQAILPTIKFLMRGNAKIVLLSHRGRPQIIEGKTTDAVQKKQFRQFSLQPFVEILENMTGKKVFFIPFRWPLDDFLTHAHTVIHNASPGTIFLAENLRFMGGEADNDISFARRLAMLGTLYVNDAFSMDHRVNASVVAITRFILSYAGLSLEKEVKNLTRIQKNAKQPLIVIIGGVKISDKIGLVKKFISKTQFVLVGGGVANTFAAAIGIDIGKSLYEENMVPMAKEFLKTGKIVMPLDSVTQKTSIFDIGPKTINEYRALIKKARAIIWNGPLGMTGDKRFRKGTEEIAKEILGSSAMAVVGGGETVSMFQEVVEHTNRRPRSDRIFLSTGGGAMLEFLAGEKLPGIEALK